MLRKTFSTCVHQLETHNSSCAQQPNRRSSCAIVLVCAILVVAVQRSHAPPQHKQAKPKWLRERARTIPGHHHTKMLAKRRRELSARSTGFNWKLAVPAYIDQWTKQLPRRSQERDRARPGREVSLYAHFDGTCESTGDTPAILVPARNVREVFGSIRNKGCSNLGMRPQCSRVSARAHTHFWTWHGDKNTSGQTWRQHSSSPTQDEFALRLGKGTSLPDDLAPRRGKGT